MTIRPKRQANTTKIRGMSGIHIAISNVLLCIFLIRWMWMLLTDSLQSGQTTSRKHRSPLFSSIAILLLMLRPHLLASHLLLVVHGSGAVRSMATVLLIVYLRRIVGGGRVLVRVVVLLLAVHTSVR